MKKLLFLTLFPGLVYGAGFQPPISAPPSTEGTNSGVSTNVVISISKSNSVIDMNTQTGLTGGAAAAAATAAYVAQLGFSHFPAPDFVWYPYMSTSTSAGGFSPNLSFDFALPMNFGTSAGYNDGGLQNIFSVNVHSGNQTNNDITHNSDGNILCFNYNLWKYAQMGTMSVDTNGAGIPFHNPNTWAAWGVGNRFAAAGFAGVAFGVTASLDTPYAFSATTGDWGNKGSTVGLNQQVIVSDFRNGFTYFMHPVIDVMSFTNALSKRAVTVDHFNDILTVRSNVQSMTSIATNWMWAGTPQANGIASPGGIASEFSSNVTSIVYGGGLAIDGTAWPYSFFGIDSLSGSKLRAGMVKQGNNYPMYAVANGAPMLFGYGSTDNLMNSNSTFSIRMAIATDGSFTNVNLTGSGRRLVEADANGKLYAILATNAATGPSSLSYNPNQFTATAGGTLLNIKETASVSNIVASQGSFLTDVSLTISNRPGSTANLIEAYTNANSLIAYLNSNGVWFCSTLLLAPGDAGIRRLNSSTLRVNNGIADSLNDFQVGTLYASTDVESINGYYINTNASKQLVIDSLSQFWSRNVAITNHLNAGTNIVGESYNTNYHTIALPQNADAWSMYGDTGTGSNYVNVPMFTKSQTNSGNIQSATLNVTGASAMAGNLTMGSSGSINISGGAQSLLISSSAGKGSISVSDSGTYYIVIGNQDKDTGVLGYASSMPGGTVSPALVWNTNKDVKVSGITTSTNGFQSVARNLATPIAITVGSSPLLLTNSSATALGGTNNGFVFIDGSGVTGTVGINGTTVFSGVTGADCTIPLQPGEYVTVTWSVGTPVVKWKPF